MPWLRVSELKILVEQRYARVGELDAEQERLKAQVLRLRHVTAKS